MKTCKDDKGEKRPVKFGLGTLDKRMTRKQAKRWGERHMPRSLKDIGFECVVTTSMAELHGGEWFRVSYAGAPFKGVPAR